MSDIIISPTQLSVWRTCPKSYQYKYIQHRVPIVVDEKLTFGRLWDDATKIWWEEGIDSVYEYLVDHAGAIDEMDAIKIATLIKHYSPPPGFSLVESQAKVDVDIVHPETGEVMPNIKLRCKADGILVHDDGSIVVREAKITVKDIEGFGPYWQVLTVDSQVGFYWIAFGAEYMVYDVAHKPQIKPSNEDIGNAALENIEGYTELSKTGQAKARKEVTKEQQMDAYAQRLEGRIVDNPDSSFQWRNIVKTDIDIRRTQEDLWELASLLNHCRENQMWPRFSHSCASFFGTCSYLPVCANTTSIDDDKIYTAPNWAKGKKTLPF